jgi:hypothetical protein
VLLILRTVVIPAFREVALSLGEWVKPSDQCSLVLCRNEATADGQITT